MINSILLNANKCFFKFISDIVDPSVGIRKLKKVSKTLKRLYTHGMIKKSYPHLQILFDSFWMPSYYYGNESQNNGHYP